jgi:hypothetical protein
MTKLALVRTATGEEDPDLPLLQRISSLKLPASEIAAQFLFHPVAFVSIVTHCTERHKVADTSQHQLFRGDCMKQAIMVALLQINHYPRTPIRRGDFIAPRNTSNGH